MFMLFSVISVGIHVCTSSPSCRHFSLWGLSGWAILKVHWLNFVWCPLSEHQAPKALHHLRQLCGLQDQHCYSVQLLCLFTGLWSAVLAEGHRPDLHWAGVSPGSAAGHAEQQRPQGPSLDEVTKWQKRLQTIVAVLTVLVGRPREVGGAWRGKWQSIHEYMNKLIDYDTRNTVAEMK